MKKTIKAISLALSLAFTLTAVPVTGCSAETYSDSDYIYIKQPEETVKVDFVVLGYSEKNSELTITGCYDYEPNPKLNPYRKGFIAVCVFDGVLEIPSHIDDKPVVDIKNLSGNDKFYKIIVPDRVTKILKSAFKDKHYEVDTAKKELRLVTLYC